ncbi:MAG: hypothetical protein KF868_16850 [Acidobacteria bacterium]|nr:hypothetical protein [Acidobacteriota bacterium]
MDVRALQGNNNPGNERGNERGSNNADRWEQLIGRGAFYCGRCDQAWLLIAADDSVEHICKNCGDPLAQLIRGRPVALKSARPEGGQPDRRIA